MILDILTIFILGILKLLSGIDFLTISALYLLMFSTNFKTKRFILYVLGAEFFNFGVPGLYILGLGLVYLGYRYKDKIFHKFFPIDILLFALAYFIFRIIYNLPIVINCGINMYVLIFRVSYNLLWAVVIIFAFRGIQKCFPGFTSSAL